MATSGYAPYRVVLNLARERLPPSRVVRGLVAEHATLQFDKQFVYLRSGDLESAESANEWIGKVLDVLAESGGRRGDSVLGERVRVEYVAGPRPMTSFAFPGRLCAVLGLWGIAAMPSPRDRKSDLGRAPRPVLTDVYPAGHFLVALRIRHATGAAPDLGRVRAIGGVGKVRSESFNITLPRCRTTTEVVGVVLEALDTWSGAPPVPVETVVGGELDIGYLVPCPETTADVEIEPGLLRALGKLEWDLRVSYYLTTSPDSDDSPKGATAP